MAAGSRKRKTGGKELRVGNFRAVYAERSGVPVIEVMDLEGTWCVRIPVHFEMYGMLNRLLLAAGDAESAEGRDARLWLHMFFMNWQNATGIVNGYYHQAVMMLAAAYSDPSLLKSSFRGPGRKFHADAKSLRIAFLKWADERDRLSDAHESGTDAVNDALADEAAHIQEDGI